MAMFLRVVGRSLGGKRLLHSWFCCFTKDLWSSCDESHAGDDYLHLLWRNSFSIAFSFDLGCLEQVIKRNREREREIERERDR
jgi:hypothetical protein